MCEHRAEQALGRRRRIRKTDGVVAPQRDVVLIVDDEPILRVILRHTLEAADYTVLEAANGVEAFAILESAPQRVSAVLSDITMPRMDGLALVDRLEASHPTLPIILASGLHRRDTIPPSTANRIRGFLEKPYSRSTVLAVVATVVSGGVAA